MRNEFLKDGFFGSKAPFRMTPGCEVGRSLTEMLAMLAIYAIITLTGISGFRYLIHKHHANTILSEAQMHATLLAGNALNSGLPENAALNTLTYPFTYKKESDVAYSLNVDGVDKAVCQILWGTRNLGWAETVLVNNGADCAETNTISFFVNTAMTTETTNQDRVVPCENDEACGECGTCNQNSHLCVFTDTLCAGDTPYCNKGVCQACEVGMFMDTKGNCLNCSTKDNITVLKDHCQHMCPNRIYVSIDSDARGYCSLPCEDGQMRAADGKCYPCNHPVYLYSNSDVCLRYCPNRIFSMQICSIKQGDCEEEYVLQDTYDGTCLKCDSLGTITSNRVRNNNCLTACGELREIATYSGTDGGSITSCALKVCPNEAPIRRVDGGCSQCGKLVAYVISADECEKCRNSYALVDPIGRTYCSACPTSPVNSFKNNARGCIHCGFKWENEKCVST